MSRRATGHARERHGVVLMVATKGATSTLTSGPAAPKTLFRGLLLRSRQEIVAEIETQRS